MKYIDTDKLIARIQWLKKKQDITLRERNILIDIEIAIDSLQQEQGEKKTFDDYLKASPAERRKMNMTEILGAEKLAKVKEMMEQEQEQPTCKTCGFYENNCPFIRGKLIPYPNKVCKDYTYSAMKEQEQTEVDLEQEVISYFQGMWPGIDANTTMSFTPPAIMRLVKHFYGLGKEQKPKVMQEVSDNVDKLRAISTPAEEDWFKIAEEWEKEDKEDAMTEQGFRIIDDGIWISRSELEKMRRKFFGSALEAMDVKKYDPYRNGYFGGMNNLCLELLIRIDGCRRPLTEGTSCALNFQTDDHASDH